MAQLVTYLDKLGVDYEEVPTATPAQGGGYERAGGVINAKARAIFIATRFPEEDLWPEVIHTATLLVNLTPRYQNGWESPWMVWHEAANRRLNTAYFVEKPDVSFMRILGCRAYPLNEIGKAIAQHKPISAAIQQSQGHPKFGPRAHLGYLVGYGSTLFRKHSTNIYRIWCLGL